MGTRVGIGVSGNLNSERAGKDACKQAIRNLGKNYPTILFVFISTVFDQEATISGIRYFAKDVPLVGLSTIASITSFGSFRNAVTVCAVSSDKFKFSADLITDLSKNPESKTTELCKEISNKLKGAIRQLCVLFSESLVDSSNILKGAYVSLGSSFPIIGGTSMDDLRFQNTFQYFNGMINMGSMIGVLIGGNVSFSIGRSNAWRPIGRPHTITRSNGNSIIEIDRKRACEIYEYYLDKRFQELKMEGMAKLGSTYPLGYKIEGTDEYATRTPIKLYENGNIISTADLPEGKDIYIMKTDKNFVLESTKDACIKALKKVDRSRIRFAFCFSDISRYQILQKDRTREVEIIKDVLGDDVPFFGCYTCGEYAPIDQTQYKGKSYFHNHSITITLAIE